MDDFAVRKHRQTFVRQERTSFAAVAHRGEGAFKESGDVLHQTTKLSTFLFTENRKRNFLLLWSRNAQLFCHPHQLCQRAGPHLLHDSSTLDFDRKFSGPQLGGNLLIE